MSCHAVVVIERDALIRETLIDVLREEGYGVHGAEDMRQAFAILEDLPHPCLILADLLSTGMDGADFLQLRRHDAVLVQVPVAIMSSVDVDPGAGAALRERGADAYIRKPFDIDQFLHTVRQYCDALG